MTLVYRHHIPRRMYNFFTVSVILHLAIVIFFATRKSMGSSLFITEVSYMEENLPTPEASSPQSPSRVGYLIPPKNLEDAIKGIESQTPWCRRGRRDRRAN